MNFPTCLREIVDSLELSHTSFAARAGMTKSKLSRIMGGHITVSKATLDRLLAVIPPSDRRRLVIAYLQDAASPQAIASLRVHASADPWQNLADFRLLSSKGAKALRVLLENAELPRIEHIFIDLAGTLGWEP